MPSLKNEPLFRLRKWNLRDLVVVGQIALSITLIISSVLVVRSLQHALTLNLGFRPEGAYSVAFDLRSQGYSDQRSLRFDAELLARTSVTTDLQANGLINTFPLNLAGIKSGFIGRADRPVPKPADRKTAITYNISPGYFKAAGTQLLSGQGCECS